MSCCVISAACHKKPLLLSVSGVRLLYGRFCETSAEVTNYLIAFCETMRKPGATEIEF